MKWRLFRLKPIPHITVYICRRSRITQGWWNGRVFTLYLLLYIVQKKQIKMACPTHDINWKINQWHLVNGNQVIWNTLLYVLQLLGLKDLNLYQTTAYHFSFSLQKRISKTLIHVSPTASYRHIVVFYSSCPNTIVGWCPLQCRVH